MSSEINFCGFPVEVRLKIFRYAVYERDGLKGKRSAINRLKLTSKEFYVFYNEMFFEKLIKEFGRDYIGMILDKVLDRFIKPYIRAFEYCRRRQRLIIKNFLKLAPQDEFFKDSFQMVYSILKNRRLFASYDDYKTDTPLKYHYNNFVTINRTYLLSYNKTICLTPDLYNLSCGIIVENCLGLGTTKFQILDHYTKKPYLEYYPPTNINDILPNNKFVLLNLGDFKIPNIGSSTNANSNSGSGSGSGSHSGTGTGIGNSNDNLVKVDVVMEETGLYIKSGFSICFIDVNVIQPEYTDHVFVPSLPSAASAEDNNAESSPVRNSTAYRRRSSTNNSGASAVTGYNNYTNESSNNGIITNGITATSTGRRRSSISLHSSLPTIKNHEDFDSHNFLFWYIDNDIDPPFDQNLCNPFLKNIYKAIDLIENDKLLTDDQFDFTPYKDLEHFNQNFYSHYCLNNNSQKIKRIFKFLTIHQQKEYDMEVTKSRKEYELLSSKGLINNDDVHWFNENTPLKWKLQSLLEI
ncbi:hypothetical protein PACTADRAFT_49786 [Pachysolen tannophilus NRRL Y-2460]|uniref:Uncharacterized protein n=1 Tax=Pachysolen tannophilus NRRL Y-2460 TaxID=669874 RepID=A0A1E4TXP6_PACTA|nr:hypothetical protein PACTADRAFT_49786 [Pachysolen tannophilus NRRL Y-2460]